MKWVICRPLAAVVALLALCAVAPTARAVVAAKLPVAKVFDGSRVVIVGAVTKVNPESGGIEASAKALKGTTPGDAVRFKVDIEKLPALLAAIKPGSPYVLLTGKKPENFALHIGDTWVLPQPTDNPQLFSVRHEIDLKQSYPGTTAALVTIVESKAAGKYDMLDEVTPQSLKAMLRGGVKEIGRIEADGITRLLAVRAPDRHDAVYGVTSEGLKRLYSVTPTEGLAVSSAPAPVAAADTIAMTPGESLTAAGQLTRLGGGGTSTKRQLWPEGFAASAAAFGNFGEEPDKTYALVIRDNDVLRYALDGQGKPADFLRLTGERVTSYHKDHPKWLAGATAAAVDANGDRRTDFLINTASGAMLLINRGHGAFFVDPDVDKALRTPDGRSVIGGGDVWTCVDVNADGYDDLLIVSKTGACRVVMNQKPEEKK